MNDREIEVMAQLAQAESDLKDARDWIERLQHQNLDKTIRDLFRRYPYAEVTIRVRADDPLTPAVVVALESSGVREDDEDPISLIVFGADAAFRVWTRCTYDENDVDHGPRWVGHCNDFIEGTDFWSVTEALETAARLSYPNPNLIPLAPAYDNSPDGLRERMALRAKIEETKAEIARPKADNDRLRAWTANDEARAALDALDAFAAGLSND